MEVFSRRKVQRYLAYFFAWTVFGFFNFSRDLTRRLYWHEATHWQETLVSWMVGVYLTAALTPVVLWLGRRWSIERQTWRTRVPVHLALSAAFSAVELALETTAFIQLRLVESVTEHSFMVGFPALLVTGFHENIITYWGILGIQWGFRYYRGFREREMHASELKAQLVKAQLSALKMQLQPHFLFNTLNAIMVLVRQQRGRQAEEMLARLSDLLRCVLEDVEAQQIPLRRELEYLRLYLSIEQVRFQDRLGIEITADDTALDAAVPHMGLQPIVENAVRHGIGRVAAAGIIRISALRTGQTLIIRVADDGPGLGAADLTEGRGIGLANTRARLHQLYGDAASLQLENGERGVVATMTMPYRAAAETPGTELHAFDSPDRR
ncbi:MAG: histidine kinase [Bryobacteraceae bacterium]|jgi:two-component system, LytTR family, sensor kinase